MGHTDLPEDNWAEEDSKNAEESGDDDDCPPLSLREDWDDEDTDEEDEDEDEAEVVVEEEEDDDAVPFPITRYAYLSCKRKS